MNQGADTKTHCFHHGVLCWFPFLQVKSRMRGCCQVCVKENSNKSPVRGKDRCNYWQMNRFGGKKKGKHCVDENGLGLNGLDLFKMAVA